MEAILESIFLKVLNMSMTASYIIIAVIIVRLLLRRAPKKYSYALWAVAAFRLICPVSFKSVISIFSLRPFSMPLENSVSSPGAAEIVHIPADIGFMAQPEIHTGLPAVNAVVNESLPAATPMASVNPIQIWTILGAYVWLLGIIALLAMSAVSLVRLHRFLRTATRLGSDVWQSENVRSPFIVGFFRPKIYIPYGLTEPRLGYVLSHERAHIKRLDHIARTLAYLVLCLHWFNPLVWLAFWLMGRDMELSCDERVLERIGDRTEYSETLLSFAFPRRFPTPTPLAFGESGVSQRIKNALKWRKPKLWVSLMALVLCLGVIAACAANPKEEKTELWGDWVSVDYDYLSSLSSTMYIDGDNGRLYRITEEQGLTVRSHFNPDFDVYEDYDPIWGWQDFPYTDDEWAEMIMLYSSFFPAPISEMYEEILYQPLIDKTFYAVSSTDAPTTENFLLLLDGELKMVYSNVDKNGKQSIWSIISLERVEELGTATFAYEPEKTGSEPGIEIRFPDDFQVNYQCLNGSVAAYNAVGERFTEGENIDVAGFYIGNIPAGGKLFWSPVKETDKGMKTAEFDVIGLNIYKGFHSFYGYIYIDSENGTYTLTTAGSDTRLQQNADGSVSVVLSDEAIYLMENMVKTPEELPDEKCPYDWTSRVTSEDIKGLSSRLGIDGAVLTSDEFIEALTAALRSAKKSDFTKETSLMNAVDIILDVRCGEGVYTLLYNDGVVELNFSESLIESRYPNLSPGTWRLRCDELNALLESVYKEPNSSVASTTDLGDGSPWAFLTGLKSDKIGSVLIRGGGNTPEDGVRVEDITMRVLIALYRVAPEEIYVGRGAPNLYAISMGYEGDRSRIRLGYCGDFVELQLDGEAAEQYAPVGGPVWEIHNDELTALLAELAAAAEETAAEENSLRYVYYVNDNPSLQLDFGEYDSLELTYEGGNILFSADGEGWGDFSGSRVFFAPTEIRWSPMEPVDDENVLARRVDSGILVFGVTKNGVTYGGTIDITGKDGVYTVSAPSDLPVLRQAEDGSIVVMVD